jgi:hypothetical protein
MMGEIMNAPLSTATHRKALTAARRTEKTGAGAWLEKLRAHSEEFTSMRTNTRLPFERVCIAHDAGKTFRASDAKAWQPVPHLENFIQRRSARRSRRRCPSAGCV